MCLDYFDNSQHCWSGDNGPQPLPWQQKWYYDNLRIYLYPWQVASD